MKSLIRILAHAVFILSLSSITFLILNVYNPLMGFTASEYSRAVFLALAVLAAILAVLLLARAGVRKKEREQKSPEDAAER